MSLGRLLTISVNALAFLILGMAGAATANVVTIDQLTVYGPQFLSGVQDVLEFVSITAISLSGLSGVSGVSGGVQLLYNFSLPSASLYAVAPFLSNIETLAQTAYTDVFYNNALLALFSSIKIPSLSGGGFDLHLVVLLPPNDPIFATTPLPSSASLMICGIAAFAFFARFARRRLGRTPAAA